MKQRATGRSVRRAFTLLEVIVAVGILAVVTVAIATVFNAVGETVSAGSRLSTLNRLAFRIETVMGRDFEGLREGTGFLVIRNEYAQRNWDDTFETSSVQGSFDAVPLFDGDPDPRLRRIDEIMFFSDSNRFRTRRTPLHPALVAESNEARIYYGHGQRMPQDVDADGTVVAWADRNADDEDWRYERPRLDDLNDIAISATETARLGQASTAGFVNPNEFASDWMLVRHVTLLRPPAADVQEFPDDIFGMDPVGTTNPAEVPLAQARVYDNSRQISLQPAAQSIFQPISGLNVREVESLTVNVTGSPQPWGVRAESISVVHLNDSFNKYRYGNLVESFGSPSFLSGLVDIATTDLEEIRSIVTTGAASSPGPSPFTPFELMQIGSLEYYDEPSVGINSFQFRRSDDPATNPTRVTPAATTREDQVQQEWMLAALPSIAFDPQATSSSDQGFGFRMRAERTPPNLYPPIREVVSSTLQFDQRFIDGQHPNGTRVQEMMAAIEQADQEMLVSNVFLPRCSEFIVEWSYGVIDRRPESRSSTSGQLIWHGLRRWQDLPDGAVDGVYDRGTEPLIADLFYSNPSGDVPEYDGDRMIEFQNEFSIPQELRTGPMGSQTMDPRFEALCRVRDRDTPTSTAVPDPDRLARVEYAWGYLDQADTDSDGVVDEALDWPWPTLIRITLRVSEASDPSVEQTYQVVFRVQKPGEGQL
ncbi:MAG: prepilin-type N-terminal cleavage/methylation domain-containing protein [Planctomycetota bacterium]